jgi:lactate dehydrogenase-like 2-hydroxyacid dehydrogenase
MFYTDLMAAKPENEVFRTASIVGFGRFGKLLAELLKPDFEVSVYDHNGIGREIEARGCRAVSIEDAMGCDAVFFCDPHLTV